MVTAAARIHVFVIGVTDFTAIHDDTMSRPRTSPIVLALTLTAALLATGVVTSGPAQATGPSLTFTSRTTANGLGSNLVSGVYAVGSMVYAATDGGVSISTNGGVSFTNRTTANGLGSDYIRAVYVDDTIYAATQDGLSISTNGGASFTNRTWVAGLRANDARAVYALDDTVYAATASGLSISRNGGATFTTAAGGDVGTEYINSVYAAGSMVYAAHTPSWLRSGLSRSTNSGATFTTDDSATNGLPTETVRGIYAVGSSVYAATAAGSGGVYVSTNYGTTFTRRSMTDGLGSNQVNGVYAVGSNVYAATSGGLSVSSDGGATFTNYTTAHGLASNWVSNVYVVGSTIYAATDSGLSISTSTAAPGRPSTVGATPGDSSASVTWVADDTGGSALTRIEFALDDTATVDDSTTNVSGPHTLTGLTNGQSYVVYVRAVNASGAGAWSTASAPFTPQAPAPPPPPPAFPPSVPLDVKATAGDASAMVTWSSPASAGSYAISHYRAIASPGGAQCLVDAATKSCVLSGLDNGTTYTVSVQALSAAGWSASSQPSPPVTPAAPVTPTLVIAGSRSGALISVTGTSAGLGVGAILTPWVHFAGRGSATRGNADILADADGSFVWQRKARRSASVHVTTADGALSSNTVTIAAR